MYDEKYWENFNFYETLKSSLEEALAYSRGEPNECRVTRISTDDPEYKEYIARKAQAADNSAVERL